MTMTSSHHSYNMLHLGATTTETMPMESQFGPVITEEFFHSRKHQAPLWEHPAPTVSERFGGMLAQGRVLGLDFGSFDTLCPPITT